MDIKLAVAIREATALLPNHDVTILFGYGGCRVFPREARKRNKKTDSKTLEHQITIFDIRQDGDSPPVTRVLCTSEINEALALAAGTHA